MQVFDQLGDDSIREVVKNMLGEVAERMARLGVSLTFADSTVDLLCRTGFTVESGARELRRSVTRLLEDELADYLLARPDNTLGLRLIAEASGSSVQIREVVPMDCVPVLERHPILSDQGEQWDYIVEEVTVIPRPRVGVNVGAMTS
jgi:hypothetical protein